MLNNFLRLLVILTLIVVLIITLAAFGVNLFSITLCAVCIFLVAQNF